MTNPDFSLEFDLTAADFTAMLRHLNAGARPSMTKPGIVLVASGFVASLVLGFLGVELDLRTFAFGMMVSAGVILLFAASYQAQLARRCTPKPGGYLLCRHRIAVDADALVIETPLYQSKISWFPAMRVEETSTHVFITFDVASAGSIPKTAFQSPAHATRFMDFVRARVAASAAQTTDAAGA